MLTKLTQVRYLNGEYHKREIWVDTDKIVLVHSSSIEGRCYAYFTMEEKICLDMPVEELVELINGQKDGTEDKV